MEIQGLLNTTPPLGTVIIASSRTHVFAAERTHKAAEIHVFLASEWQSTGMRVFGMITRAAAWGSTLFYTTRAGGVFALGLVDGVWRASNNATLVDYDADTDDAEFYPLDARTCLFRFFAEDRTHLVRIVFGHKIECLVLSANPPLPPAYYVTVTERGEIWAVTDNAVHMLLNGGSTAADGTHVLPPPSTAFTRVTVPVKFDHKTIDDIMMRPRGAYYVTSQYTGPCIAIEYETLVRLTPVPLPVGETRPRDYVDKELLEIKVTSMMDIVYTETNMYIATLAGNVVAVYLPALAPDVCASVAPNTTANMLSLPHSDSRIIHPTASGVAGAVLRIESPRTFSLTTQRWRRVYESQYVL